MMLLSAHARRLFPKIKSRLFILFCVACLFQSVSFADTLAPITETELPPTLTSSSQMNTFTAGNKTPEYVILSPSEQVTYSSETAASVLELNVREGTRFKAGDVLLKLDCRIQRAELEKAKAQMRTNMMAGQSAERLKSYGSISELEVIKAQSDANMAAAEVDKLNAIVDKCTIIAPFNGAAAQVMVHVLETVRSGDPLLKIVNTEKLEFIIQVPSHWLSWLKIGSVFYVHLNEVNKKVTVKVVRIDPQIESVSQTVKLTGEITQPDPSLLPGMSGQAIFPENPENEDVTTKPKTEGGN